MKIFEDSVRTIENHTRNGRTIRWMKQDYFNDWKDAQEKQAHIIFS